MYSETKQPAEKHKKHIRFIMNYKKKILSYFLICVELSTTEKKDDRHYFTEGAQPVTPALPKSPVWNRIIIQVS